MTMPGWDVSPQSTKPFWGKRVVGYITARDGVQLRYSALLPAGDGPFPIIINYSGYDPGSIGSNEYLKGNTAMHPLLDKALVEKGYAVVGINARGTACSEGQFDFIGRSYGTDGYDAVEFLAALPWSNGKIGMANWSWAGMSQLATASERPPHLLAIAPGMVLGDPQADSFAPGGVAQPGFVTNWWWFLHNRWDAARDSAKAEGDERCVSQVATNYITAERDSLPSQLIRHPLRDDKMEEKNLTLRTSNINIPVLSLESSQDEATTSRGGYFHDTLKPELIWTLQTNGNHDLYIAEKFREEFLIPFFDHFLKDEKNGFERKPHVTVWEETHTDGTGLMASMRAQPRWILTNPTYPLEARPLVFTLAGGGKLVDGAASGAPDLYAYPQSTAAVNADETGAPAWGPLPDRWNEGSLAYSSEPLAKTILTHGSASADLWLSSTAADTDVQVTLTELRPDGKEVYIQRGWLRLSHRTQDTGKSTVLRPFALNTTSSLLALTPDEPVLGRVELPKFNHAFRAGSRIRLWVETPSQTGGYGFAPISTPAINKVWHDADHPSRLVLGTVDASKVPPTLSDCGAIIMQPCRADPLAGQ
ncbi:hypothetical protein ABENE_21550 [Asticcacaulis benevestitus DSM 16100 = ATCC BAA-896]|uniref:Xaa-Pro dipeptidyl-peptidase C-terminal domain-containing protein n=2 Tax=Asticcacaulis TaxID=76890 RepID=V4QRC3_9CAUL|nr:hypothetical protein ABENE_21550 [Asticcacaulis benevestitus DSM 16100 = ATCC BAA-896]